MFTGKPQHKNSASKTYYKIGGLELGMVLFIGKKKKIVGCTAPTSLSKAH